MVESAATTTEAVLRHLGVQIVSVGRQIKAYCPVHRQTVGREDQHPSWYMNATTGAWLCFSCHASGGLGHLADALGGDAEEITRYIIANASERLSAIKREVDGDSEGGEPPEADAQPYVSPYAFSKYPHPPRSIREMRDLDMDTCTLLNIRWEPVGRCWLIPVYRFDGVLLGWQEKSTGYFNNVPREMPKRLALFGYQLLSGTESVIVVESPLDAARFVQYGYESVAIFGSYISDEQVTALARSGVRGRTNVVLAYDDDVYGRSAAYFTDHKLSALDVDVRFFRYPPGTVDLDPGDLTVAELHRGVRCATVMMPTAVKEAVEQRQSYK